MGLVPCRECGNQVSTRAFSCPKCGAPITAAEPPKGAGCLPIFSFFMGVIATLVVIILLPWRADKDSTRKTTEKAAAETTADPGGGSPAGAPETSDAPLRLLSSRLDRENGEAILRGEVRNLSSETLENVMAAVVFRSRDGEAIKSESMLIAESPLEPGQKSGFEVPVRDNAAIHSGEVSFRTPSGRPIAHLGAEP